MASVDVSAGSTAGIEVSGQPRVLDGTAIASEIKKEVAEEVARLAAQGIRPGLAAVLVGNVAASQIYVRSKVKTCADLGLTSDLITPTRYGDHGRDAGPGAVPQ